MKDRFAIKIGLEIHAQIKTKTKLFSRASAIPSNNPNENITLFDIGVPGILPQLNEHAVELATKTGLALNCKINKTSSFDRKHYQYADLPFGYQITQFFSPICSDGYITLSSGKKIRINRIHMECDAGKLIHSKNKTLIDYNRAGVPLMEIVTEPDISSASETEEFLKELMLILEYIDSCDCNMENGNLRVDVNLSINSDLLQGTRVEMKNINSIKFIRDAITVEYNRQVAAVENDNYDSIVQETRGYDSDKRMTYSMRKKESFMEYRYLPDGNLPPLHLSEEYINNIKASMEILPCEKRLEYEKILPKSTYEIFINNYELGKFFDKYMEKAVNKVTFANFLVGDVLGILNNNSLPLNDERMNIIVEISNYTAENTITMKTAKLLLEECLVSLESPGNIIKSKNLSKISDKNIITEIIRENIEKNSKQWQEFIGGNDKLLMFFIGCVIKQTGGQADADITKEIIVQMANLKIY